MAKKIFWHRATSEDARDLWRWRNDPLTRKGSFSTERVPWADHRRWLASRLDDTASELWIARSKDGEPLGQVRLDRVRGGQTEVSISVAPAHRGRGVGGAMLAALPGEARPSYVAWVRQDNVASAVMFLRAGFRFERTARRAGLPAYVFRRRAVQD